MITSYRILPIVACLLAGVACGQVAPNTLTAQEKAAGWQLLFDGKTLTGWRGFLQETPPAGWKVIDGELVHVAHSGDLITQGDYADFEFSVEWKIPVGSYANSGIIYRVNFSDNETYRTGPEYQIIADEVFELMLKKNQVTQKHRTGALYDLVVPKVNFAHPTGEWNLSRVVVKGWHIEHWLNGEKVVEADLSTPEGRALIAGSKFKTMPEYATFLHGHIALQDHGKNAPLSFRNIKVRELK